MTRKQKRLLIGVAILGAFPEIWARPADEPKSKPLSFKAWASFWAVLITLLLGAGVVLHYVNHCPC